MFNIKNGILAYNVSIVQFKSIASKARQSYIKANKRFQYIHQLSYKLIILALIYIYVLLNTTSILIIKRKKPRNSHEGSIQLLKTSFRNSKSYSAIC